MVVPAYVVLTNSLQTGLLPVRYAEDTILVKWIRPGLT